MNKLDKVYDRAALLIEKKGWCKGAFAKDRNGQVCSVKSEDACCYCMSGAIEAAYFQLNEPFNPYTDVNSFRAVSGMMIMVGWNDYYAKSALEVSKMLRKMAKHAKAEAKTLAENDDG